MGTTSTVSTPVTTPVGDGKYHVVPATDGIGYNVVTPTGDFLYSTTNGQRRWFATTNSARKRISREKSGNLHR